MAVGMATVVAAAMMATMTSVAGAAMEVAASETVAGAVVVVAGAVVVVAGALVVVVAGAADTAVIIITNRTS